MKVNPKFLMMMAALAAGSASAATTTTTAGTVITNQATATFDDPATPATLGGGKASSNVVKTTVLPTKPEFDITYDDGTADNNTFASVASPKLQANKAAGSTFEQGYSLINRGNVPINLILSINIDGASSTVAADVKYYYATDIARTTAIDITQPIKLGADDPTTTGVGAGAGKDEGRIDIVQVITIPTTALKTQAFGASPSGSVAGTGVGTVVGSDTDPTKVANNYSGNGVAVGTTVYEENGAVAGDFQFSKATLISPDVVNGPPPTTAPTTPVKPDGTLDTAPPTLPAIGAVNVPTLNPGPTGTGGTTTAGDPTIDTAPVTPTTTPGYADPASTPIEIATNGTQRAYPAADGIATDPTNQPDFVTFTNSVKNNSATVPDKVQLFPTDAVKADGTLNAGWTFDAATATFTRDDGTLPKITVQFLDSAGNFIPVTAPDALTKYPTITLPAGSTGYYKTKITYPDPDDSSVTPVVSVKISVDSTKDAGFAPEMDAANNPTGTTTNIIYPAAAQFGDSTPGMQGVAATNVPVNQDVKPGTAATPGVSGGVGSAVATDPTAVFPMDLVNNGQYNDSFILDGTVSFINAMPGGPSVPGVVKYYDAAGNELQKITTGANTGKYVSPVVEAGKEIVVRAVVEVPDGTPVNPYTLVQNAKGYTSGILLTDPNNTITVTASGKVGVGKFVFDGTTTVDTQIAPPPTEVEIKNPGNYTIGVIGKKPGEEIKYRIVAKNTYNTAVNTFIFSDTVPANTTLTALGLTRPAMGIIPEAAVNPASVLYRIGTTGPWLKLSTNAIVAGAQGVGTIIQIALDDGSGAPAALPSITASPAGSNILYADFTVTVK